ncbi:MAG: DNA alkylation repair protein [Brevinema sp.]
MKSQIQNLFRAHANTEAALWSAKYMKNQFAFYGVIHPTRRKILKEIFVQSKKLPMDELLGLIFELSKGEYREEFYTAIDLITQNVKRFSYEEFQKLYPLIELNPWWDSVDSLQKPFSMWIKNNPDKLEEITNFWNEKDLFWYKRIAMIIQLHWKLDTKTEILKSLILANKHIDEFFIQKAIGWSLRDYGKHNPQWVREFLNEYEFSKLATREASKYL